MFSLRLRERLLLAAVLSAAVLGVSVKHWRDARREDVAANILPVTGASSTASAGLPAALVRRSHDRHP